MQSSRPTLAALLHLLPYISKRRKLQFALIIVIVLLVSITEVISIGSVLPFISIILSPESAQELPLVGGFLNDTAGTTQQTTIILSAAFIVALLLAGISRVALVILQSNVSYAFASDVSAMVFGKAINMPHLEAVEKDTSETIANISARITFFINSVVLPIVNLISSCILTVVVLRFIVYLNTKIAILAGATVGLAYWYTSRVTRSAILDLGNTIDAYSESQVRHVRDALGGYREITLNNSADIHIGRFSVIDSSLRMAQARVRIIQQLPRFLIETFLVILVGITVGYFALLGTNFIEFIPILGTVVFAAQRIVPVIHSAYASYTGLRAGLPTLGSIIASLPSVEQTNNDQPYKGGPLSFDHKIEFENVNFRYPKNSSDILSDVNFDIHKGDFVGIVGRSGAGKSTLLDIMLGLLVNDTGTIKVDGRVVNQSNIIAWRKNIRTVPQRIFLANTSIENNIVSGQPNSPIDKVRLEKAITLSCLDQVLNELPDGVKTIIHENGARLSGGQQQRIALARALYADPEILILDEGTNALDELTEKSVFENLRSYRHDLTVILVTHRNEALRFCDKVLYVGNSSVSSTNKHPERAS